MTVQVMRIDGLQFCNWSEPVFAQMNAARLSAVHATVAYHETFRATLDRIIAWNQRFLDHAHRIAPARSADEIEAVASSGRTAIVLGLQNPLPMEDDIGLLAILRDLGIRFMQLTYNNQSLLGTGWQEAEDTGLTRMGREVVREMNRLGIVIDLSHAGERTALEAIAASARPVAVTHATPAWWCPGGRQVSERVLQALAARDGILGLSIYPLHLRDGSATRLEAFCDMTARTAERIGIARLAIGSDLCLGQADEMLAWMRDGKWRRAAGPQPAFPEQPSWFRDSTGFDALERGLLAAGLSADQVAMVLGGNWLRFMREGFAPQA